MTHLNHALVAIIGVPVALFLFVAWACFVHDFFHTENVWIICGPAWLMIVAYVFWCSALDGKSRV